MNVIEFEDRAALAAYMRSAEGRRGLHPVIVELHERWCPEETAMGTRFCLCSPAYRLQDQPPRSRRAVRV